MQADINAGGAADHCAGEPCGRGVKLGYTLVIVDVDNYMGAKEGETRKLEKVLREETEGPRWGGAGQALFLSQIQKVLGL